MENYIDKIMTNNIYDDESSEDLYYLYSDGIEERLKNIELNKIGSKKFEGGNRERRGQNEENQRKIYEENPNGGFPPLRIIDKIVLITTLTYTNTKNVKGSSP